MKSKHLLLAAAVVCAAMTGCKSSDSTADNPFLQPYDTPYEIPPFDKIKAEHYLPAARQGIAELKEQVEAIANNPEAPTFENTVIAFENSGETLNRVMLVFSALEESNSNDEMVSIAEVLYPEYSQAQDEIM
ncbi:MAG: peptidase M3, partial [Muribaculaceae bacterium]|nr:peptidase M3 [Muribaculaceae bacterium]